MTETVTFQKILSFPKYLAVFQKFCAKESSDENLLFIQAVDRFKKESPVAQQETSIKMVDLYVKPGSLLEVNLPATEINIILAAVDAGEISQTMFDKARLTIYKLLERDTYSRFLLSKEYTLMKSTTPQTSQDDQRRRRDSIRTSSLLLRSFSIASKTQDDIGAHKCTAKNQFSTLFYNNLFDISPEAHLLFNNSITHQGTMLSNVLEQLLALMQNNDTKFTKVVSRLAGVHVHMGITSSMFRSFGKALTETLRVQLRLDKDSMEWQVLQRHWHRAYQRISCALIDAMVTLPQQSSSMFSRNKVNVPKWLGGQLREYRKHTTATIGLIKTQGKVTLFTEIFYSNFFLLSPDSIDKFSHVGKQGEALWGALDSVAKMLATPRKMHGVLTGLAKSHANKGISQEEFECFATTIRKTFKDVLKTEYTDAMNSIWKQFLELLTLFMGHASTRTSDSGTSRSHEDAGTTRGYTKGLADLLTTCAIERKPSGDSREDSDSHSKTSESGRSDVAVTFSFLRGLMPAMVADKAILNEVNKLHDELIYSVGQLKTYSLEELEKHVCSATARVLMPYLRPKSLGSTPEDDSPVQLQPPPIMA